MTLDDALTAVATRWNGQERWIAANSVSQGFSIQRTVPDGPKVYRIEGAPLNYTIARQFDDWALDWDDSDEVYR